MHLVDVYGSLTLIMNGYEVVVALSDLHYSREYMLGERNVMLLLETCATSFLHSIVCGPFDRLLNVEKARSQNLNCHKVQRLPLGKAERGGWRSSVEHQPSRDWALVGLLEHNLAKNQRL